MLTGPKTSYEGYCYCGCDVEISPRNRLKFSLQTNFSYAGLAKEGRTMPPRDAHVAVVNM